MYFEYYVNYKTGELKLVGTPEESRKLYSRDGCMHISSDEFKPYKKVAEYAVNHAK